MAKLDTAKIPNYDKLPDEVKTALAAYEIEENAPDLTGYVKKAVLS